MHISLVLAGRTVPGFTALTDSLAREFRCPVSTEFIDFPFTRSFRKARSQYDAGVLLAELGRFAVSDDKTVFIVREDIFCAPKNYVFGLANKGCAVVSTVRLDPRFYGPVESLPEARSIFIGRICKELFYEIGRILGLPDCPDKSCVMANPDSISSIDSKGKEFCARCRKALYLED